MRERSIVIAGTLPPTVGGIATVISTHVAWLRTTGWSVTTVNTGRRRRRNPGRASVENALAGVVDALRVGAACLRHRPRVVAVHTVGSPALPALRAITIVLAARASRTPVVVHLHAYDLETQVEHAGAGYRRLLRSLCQLSASVVVLHDNMRAAVLIAAPAARVTVLPNCVDVPEVATTPGAPRVVFVGTVGMRKGVPALIDAISSLPADVECDIVGGHGEEDASVSAAMVAKADAAGLGGRVTFHGELSRAATEVLVASATVLALPSRAEGMPMAVLEALALGIPAVVSDVGAIGELVRRAGCGAAVRPDDPAALADALAGLLFDPEHRQRCSIAALDVIQRDYRCDRVLPHLTDTYDGARRG